MKKISMTALGMIALLCTGCGDSDLPDSSELGKLKILTIKSSMAAGDGINTLAEYSPGDGPITLTPVISYLNGANGTTLSYDIQACVDPGIYVGAEPSCIGNPTMVSVGSGNITSLDFAHSFTGAADPATLTLPSAAVIFSNRSAVEQFNGVTYLITYSVTASDGSQARSIKRLVVSTRTSKNFNPILADVFGNGQTLSSFPAGGVVTLTDVIGATGAEGFQQMKDDESLIDRRESLVTSWFVSDGELKYLRTTEGLGTELEIPGALPTTRSKFVIAVLRDERGGIDFHIKTFP